MCMEDIRIGRRKSYSATIMFCPQLTSTLIATNKPHRTCIGFYPYNENVPFVMPAQFPRTPNNGISPTSFAPFASFDVETYGFMTCDEWYAYAVEGDLSIVVVETFLEEL